MHCPLLRKNEEAQRRQVPFVLQARQFRAEHALTVHAVLLALSEYPVAQVRHTEELQVWQCMNALQFAERQ